MWLRKRFSIGTTTVAFFLLPCAICKRFLSHMDWNIRKRTRFMHTQDSRFTLPASHMHMVEDERSRVVDLVEVPGTSSLALCTILGFFIAPTSPSYETSHSNSYTTQAEVANRLACSIPPPAHKTPGGLPAGILAGRVGIFRHSRRRRTWTPRVAPGVEEARRPFPATWRRTS